MKLQTKQRYSQPALLRTIKNRLVEAQQDATLQTIPLLKKRAESAVPALKEALAALEGMEGSDQKLLKNRALVILGRLMRPDLGQGGQAAILALRQDITAGTLDERDDTKSIQDARAFVSTVLSAAGAALLQEEIKRWEWGASMLDRLEGHVGLVNVEALWRASHYTVTSSIPFDTIVTKA